ncbi:MAG: hypothetical protein JXQ73_32810 [Phycisphaerae bacterium]|nr:hypothetical protein [Phycisphaerae bacterium]
MMTTAKPHRTEAISRVLLAGLAVMTAMAGCEHGGATTRPIRSPETEDAANSARYFFVVPQWLPGGASSKPQREALEQWLVQRAGGFTRIGPVRGGWHDGKDLIEEDSIAYFVVGPVGLKPVIETRVLGEFKQRKAFVVQW